MVKSQEKNYEDSVKQLLTQYENRDKPGQKGNTHQSLRQHFQKTVMSEADGPGTFKKKITF